MNRHVYVLPEKDFDDWVVEQGRWLDKIPAEELYFKAGPQLYARCASCHTLDGKPSTGPSWGNYDGSGNIWQRTDSKTSTHKVDGKSIADLIGDGKAFPNAQSYIRNSILNPGEHLVDGFGNVMPTFRGQLTDKGIDALIGFMQHLDEFDAKGQWTKKPAGTMRRRMSSRLAPAPAVTVPAVASRSMARTPVISRTVAPPLCAASP